MDENLFEASNRKPHSQSLAEVSIPLTQRKDCNINKQVNVSPVKPLQVSLQKNQNRRSLPRTELSAKKLQTLEQINAQLETPNPMKKKVSQSSLLAQNIENILDYKKLICSKLPTKMGLANIKQVQVSNLKQKKSIIQELVSQQQIPNKAKPKPEGRYRPQIFVNPEL